MIEIPEYVLSNLCNRFGTKVEMLKFLGGGKEFSDGTVFTFELEGKMKVLKILAMHKEEGKGLKQLEERIKFANFLGENGIKLSYPEENLSGRLYETENDGNNIFTAYQMRYYDGYHPKHEDVTPELYKSWGKVTGKMHRVTKKYPYWMNIPVENGNHLSGWEEEVNMFHDWCKDEDVKRKWLEMKERLFGLPQNRNTFGFIHNDNHVQNILWDNKEITIIDFDVANCHFFVNDLATPFQGLLFDVTGGMTNPVTDRDTLKSAFDNFMNGYEQENHLEEFWMGQIDTFVSYRRLLLFTVMQGWINSEIEVKKKFKDMIESEPRIL